MQETVICHVTKVKQTWQFCSNCICVTTTLSFFKIHSNNAQR